MSTSKNVTSPSFKLNTGVSIPALGLGTSGPSSAEIATIVSTALKLGYRYIDTAYGYHNEVGVGEGIRASGVPREDIFVTTKLDNTWHQRVTEGLNISLNQLGLDYVDLYLMHWPSPLDPDNTKKLIPNWDFVKTWSEMQRLPATGKVKAIGVSNVGVTYMEKLLNAQTTSVVPAVNQIELHPYYPCEKLVAYCQEHGVHVTGYSPLGSASLKLLDDAVIQGVSKEVGKSVAQVLLRWGVQHGWDVIPKTATVARMEENLQLDGWMLSEGQMKKIDTLPTRVKVYGDSWLPEKIFFGDD